MKFVVTSRVNNLSGCTLPLNASATQEIHLSNSRATIKTLRAVIAIKFKLPPMSFSMAYMGPRSGVEWIDEASLIEASGLTDGDQIWVLPKDVNISDILKDDADRETESINNSAKATTTEHARRNVQASENDSRSSPPLKMFRTELISETSSVENNINNESTSISKSNDSTVKLNNINVNNNIVNQEETSQACEYANTANADTTVKGSENTDKLFTSNEGIVGNNSVNVSNDASTTNDNKDNHASNNNKSKNNDKDEEDDVDEEEEEEWMEENGPDELYERLMEVTPNLMEMREEFLAHPEEVMQRIQREDPKLFNLITANEESFVELVNNVDFVRALQEEKEAGEIDWSDDGFEYDDEDDENDEMNEAAVETMHNLYLELLAGDNRGVGNISEGVSITSNENLHNKHTDNNNNNNNSSSSNNNNNNSISSSGGNSIHNNINEGDTIQDNSNSEENTGQSEVNRGFVPLPQSQISDILAYAPSEEDIRKIEGLTELGFTFDQCKVAFYCCRRSLERAANFLFESPPKL